MPVFGGESVIPNISLHEFLWERILKYGDDVAFIDCSRNDKTITYKEIYELSRKCAAFLQSEGITRGDYVAISAPSCIEYCFLILGILGSGGAFVPCNPDYKKGEILQQFRLSEPKVVFVSEEACSTMKEVQAELKCLQKIFVIGKSKEFLTLEEIIDKTNSESLQKVDINPAEDIAIVPHSSGTTGIPKGVMMTHRNYVATQSLLTSAPRNPGVSSYIDRPMYHTAGFAAILGYSTAGMKCVFERDFNVEKMLKAIERHEVTAAVAVPSNLVALANYDGIEKYDLSSFKALACGGAVAAPNVIRRVMEKLEVVYVPVYGMTEGGSVSSGLLIPGTGGDFMSSGKIKPGVELKIVNPETGSECPAETDGEICIRSPQVMKGYFKNPDATAGAFDADGWFKTGDVGHLGTNEQLYVVDRLKEVIKYDTYQVSPAELESVIFNHPKVADVGVVGIPDAKCGEIPKAFVVRKDGNITSDEIHAIVREHLVDYKHLRGGVEFVDSIPKSTFGKIQRRALKKIAGY